jgi:hypothetical protein
MIRFDTLQLGSDYELVERVKKRMGILCDYEDDEKIWNACTIPKGSEGSIQYEVILTNDCNSLARIAVAIWGDLRDYENVDEIVNWIKRIGGTDLRKDFLGVRSGIVYIEPEFKSPTVLRYDKEVWFTVHCV